jgi:hypothetical protein
MTTQYDPNVINTFADRLYERAKSLAVGYGLFGFLIGAGAGAGVAAAVSAPPFVLALMGGAVGIGFGVAIARDMAFKIRLTAQQALCQVKIEEGIRVLVERP